MASRTRSKSARLSGFFRYSTTSNSTSRSWRISRTPRACPQPGLWYTKSLVMGLRLPSGNRVGPKVDRMAEPRETFLGRDDVNDVESILADDAIDFGELSHSQRVGGDAIFTWDYDRSR